MKSVGSSLLILLTVFSAMAQPKAKSQQPKLSLKDYMSQVSEKNPALKASEIASEGAGLRVSEGSLVTAPVLSLSAQNYVDQKQTATPNFTGTKNSGYIYSATLSEQTPIGLSGKLNYAFNYRNTEGALASAVPIPQYYTGSPGIELSQSLWRNGFGSEVRATRDLVRASARATKYLESYKATAVVYETQSAYWRLFYARKTVEALKESLVLAEKFQGWAKRRAGLQLGDQSDFLQAKAALELRQLEQLKALEEEKTAGRSFNSLRGIDSYEVTEALADPDLSVSNIKLTTQLRRDDLRAAEAAAQAAHHGAIVGKEKNKPIFEIYGSYAYNSLNVDSGRAQSESWKSDYPTYAVGVRFSTPLEFGNSADARDGYRKEAEAADLGFQRKLQEHLRDVDDLSSKLKNASDRLTLAQSLEKSQKEKLAAERNRLSKGRTTTAQVILFEQDHISAQLNRIRTEAELLSLIAQTRFYRED